MNAKRPVHSAQISPDEIRKLKRELEGARAVLESHAARLRSLDVKRHNSVGIRRKGFIDRAKEIAETNEEFLPHWLTLEKFSFDSEHFNEMRNLVDIIEQLQKLASNILVISSDMAYTDALEFYEAVKNAAKRRVDASESIFTEMEVFFKPLGSWVNGMETQKKLKKDVNALLKGTKDGEIIVENISPKEVKGKKTVIDNIIS